MAGVSYQEFLLREARLQAARRRPLRVTMVFLAIFFALQYGWEMSRGSALEHLIIEQATVRPAAFVIGFVWPTPVVVAQGHSLASAQARLNILNGCEGLDILFLLIAASLAYPFSWRLRFHALMLGVPLVFALNQLRIVALWQALLHDRAVFSILHGTVLPLLLVAASLLFFMSFLAQDASEPA